MRARKVPARYPSAAYTLQGNKARVWEYMCKKGPITALEAQALFRCFNLHARITELKKLGFPVNTVIRTDITGKNYAAYGLTIPQEDAVFLQ